MASGVNPVLQTAALAGLEAAINRALELDPAGRAALAALGDCVFSLHCTAPRIDLFMQPGGDGIRLMGVYEGPVTTSVRGTAADFAELVAAADPAAALINGALALRGDSAPLIQLQKALAHLELDWEAPLVDLLGDVAGHQVAGALRSLFSWGQQASGNLARQLQEFIHEEARLSPPRLELEDFFRDVQELELRVERLQSRTRRLRARLHSLRPK
jgi:ubiquinone biosynthesis protein UbiJ